MEVLHIVDPLGREEPVDPVAIALEVLEVGQGKIVERYTVGQFLSQVEHRPEQVGERFVLEQVRIFKEPQQEIPPLAEEHPEPAEIDPVDIDRVLELEQCFPGLFERAVLPCGGIDDERPDGVDAGIGLGEKPQEGYPRLGEERPDHHVQFLQERLPLMHAQQAVNDERDQQHLDEHERDIAEHIDEDMAGIPENEVMHVIEERGTEEERDSEQDRLAILFHDNFTGNKVILSS